jgi:diacylglycerol kinase family enzyme
MSAAVALAALASAVLVIADAFVHRLPFLPLIAAGLLVAVVAGWTSLVCRGRRRWLSLLVSLGALAGTLVALGLQTLLGMIFVVVLVAISNTAARVALRADGAPVHPLPSGRRVAPATGAVLLMNPRSGGGKVGRFQLVDEARRRGVRPVLLRPGDDLRALAERAVADGATVLGAAGGDGSLAVVADVARAHDVAFVCVPAGTRNHFALDLGLDRDDVTAALDAFGEAVERRVDLATVNGRVFVNNASLGVYAAVVQSATYRAAKIGTAATMIPDLLGPQAPPFDLRYEGPDGRRLESADVILVSNNPYALRTLSGLGARPRLDTGVLGIVTVRTQRPGDLPAPPSLPVAGAAAGYPGLAQWTARSFQVDSSGPVPVGVDGEAMRLPPPLVFGILPAALRVRLPLTSPGATHTTVRPPGMRQTVNALVRVLAGRPVGPGWGQPVVSPRRPG